MTNGQSASLSWCQAAIWVPRPDFCYCQTIAGLLIWGTLSDEGTGLSFTIAADCHQCSYSWVLVLQDSEPFLLSQIQDFQNPPPCRARSPYLYPPGTGWPSYTPRHWVSFLSPHTTCRAVMEVWEPTSTLAANLTKLPYPSQLCSLRMDHTENIISNRSSITVCIYIAMDMFIWTLPSSGFFSHHFTVLSSDKFQGHFSLKQHVCRNASQVGDKWVWMASSNSRICWNM
jgi:hypothetical protein